MAVGAISLSITLIGFNRTGCDRPLVVYEWHTPQCRGSSCCARALGFMLPILLIGHAANTRLAWELFGMPSDYGGLYRACT